MNVLALTHILASLVIIAIGISVLLRDRTQRTYTSFSSFAFVVAAWHLGNFIAMTTRHEVVIWLSFWPAATLPPTALAFFREFLAEPSIGGKKRPQRFTIVWTLAVYITLIYSAIFYPLHQHLGFKLPFAIYVFGSIYRCVYDLYKQYQATATRVERIRILYLMLGGLVATTLVLTGFIPGVNGIWPTLGNVLTILYLYFLSQTLFRYRLLDLHELLGKMMVLVSLVILLWAVYGLLLNWVGSGHEGLFLLNAVVASFLILVLFEPVRNALENAVNRWIIRQRHELRARVESLYRELVNVVDVAEMTALLTKAMEESRRVTHFAIYLTDSDSVGYDLADYFGPQKPLHRVDAGSLKPFIAHLRAGYVDIERLKHKRDSLTRGNSPSPDIDAIDQSIQVLNTMQASLLVPILGSEETEQGAWLLGLLALRDERAQAAFNMDDVDVFRLLANHVAANLEAMQVYERFKERDRLAAIGEMAAGLAHEIRNPLGAIKGAAQLLVSPDGIPVENNHDTAEFLGIIVEEVNRLNKVVTQFLDYARPSKIDSKPLSKLNLNHVVKKTVQLLETEGLNNIKVEIRLDELLPPIAGDPEQLRQVFLNLSHNAIQAMESGGCLEIVTTRRRRSRLGYGSFAEVRFHDTGAGIAHEDLKHLFIPFYTTKQRGTGLGLAISQRIVTQHNGTIEVRSTPEEGSTFSVFLPALGSSLPPDNARHSAHNTITQPVSGFRAPP